MCTGAELYLIAAAVTTTTATLYQADTAKNTADANAELARREGEQAKDNAVAQAERIRKAGRAAVGRANTSLAGSGVSIESGSGIRVNEEIYRESESDAYNTLLTGTRQQRASEQEASIYESEGRSAKTGGYLSAGASLLSTGASYGKWQSSQKKGGG